MVWFKNRPKAACDIVYTLTQQKISRKLKTMSLPSRRLTPTTTRLSSSLPSSASPHFPSIHFASPSLLRSPLSLTTSSTSSFSRLFASSPPATPITSTMGDVPDADMDAVQRRLMFDDESVSYFSPSFSCYSLVSVYVDSLDFYVFVDFFMPK